MDNFLFTCKKPIRRNLQALQAERLISDLDVSSRMERDSSGNGFGRHEGST